LEAQLEAAQKVAEVKGWLKVATPDEKKAMKTKLKEAKAELVKSTKVVFKKQAKIDAKKVALIKA
jgi:hypothetical protein